MRRGSGATGGKACNNATNAAAGGSSTRFLGTCALLLTYALSFVACVPSTTATTTTSMMIRTTSRTTRAEKNNVDATIYVASIGAEVQPRKADDDKKEEVEDPPADDGASITPSTPPTSSPTEVDVVDCTLHSSSEDDCDAYDPDCEWWISTTTATADATTIEDGEDAIVPTMAPTSAGTGTSTSTSTVASATCRNSCDAYNSRSSSEYDCVSTAHCEWISHIIDDIDDDASYCRTRVGECRYLTERRDCKDAYPNCEWDDDMDACIATTHAPTSVSPTTTNVPTNRPSFSTMPTMITIIESPTSPPTSDGHVPSVPITETDAPASSSPSTSSNDGNHDGYPIPRPLTRFVPWDDLDEGARSSLGKNLGYTELTWNVHRLAEVESRGHYELMYYEEDAATTILGLDERGWDCWMNHYESYGWADMEERGIATSYAGLGWSQSSWEDGADPPESDSKSWNELTEAERLHAKNLCYDMYNWDMIDMTRNDGPFPFPLPTIRFTPWDELTPELRLIAENVMLYDVVTWNDLGLADIESRAWDDLTEEQRPYAIRLGLYSRTWDCFQNVCSFF